MYRQLLWIENPSVAGGPLEDGGGQRLAVLDRTLVRRFRNHSLQGWSLIAHEW